MKRKQLRKAYLGVVVMTVLLSIGALAVIWGQESAYRSSKGEVWKVRIVGDYYLDGSSEAIPLDENTEFDLEGINTVTVYGTFTKDIDKDMKLLMRIDNMKVHIEINGEKVYSFGEEQSVALAKSQGNLWDSFLTEGISKQDHVKITLTNLYTHHVNSTFKTFFNNIYYGVDHDFVKDSMDDKLLNCFLAVLIVCMGVFVGVFACMCYRMKQPSGLLACFSGLSFCGGIWFFIDFDIQNILFPSPVFNNSLDMVMMLFTSYFVLCFIARHIRNRWRQIIRMNAVCFLLTIQFATVMQMRGALDYYETYPAVYIFGFTGCIVSVAGVVREWRQYHTKEARRLMATCLILAAGAIGDLLGIYTEVRPYMLWFKVSIFLFLSVEFVELLFIIRRGIIENAKISVLENMAYKDALTGAKNRAAYLERVCMLEKKNDTKSELAVIVLDINNLKQVNDRDGHEMGDWLIKRSCRLMESVFGSEDLYRIGGDEFVIVLEGEKTAECTQKLQEFRYRCRKEELEIACGISSYHFKWDSGYQDVFGRADEAMYEQKKRMKDEQGAGPSSECPA